MHYCLPIGQFVKNKACQFSSVQLRRAVRASRRNSCMPDRSHTTAWKLRLKTIVFALHVVVIVVVVDVARWNRLQSWMIRPTKTSTNPDRWALRVWPTDRIRIDHDLLAWRLIAKYRPLKKHAKRRYFFLLRTANIRYCLLVDRWVSAACISWNLSIAARRLLSET